MNDTKSLREAVRALAVVWLKPGVNLEHHANEQRRLVTAWPSLYRALQDVLAAAVVDVERTPADRIWPERPLVLHRGLGGCPAEKQLKDNGLLVCSRSQHSTGPHYDEDDEIYWSKHG